MLLQETVWARVYDIIFSNLPQPFWMALSNSLSLLHFDHYYFKIAMNYSWSQRMQFTAALAQDKAPFWIILSAYISVLLCKRLWQKAQTCQWSAGRSRCWVVLCLNYLLAASLGTMATVAQIRESPRTTLNWVTARRRKRKKSWYWHRDEMPCLFSWGQNHLWPQQLVL